MISSSFCVLLHYDSIILTEMSLRPFWSDPSSGKQTNCKWTFMNHEFDMFKPRKQMQFVKLAATVFSLCRGCLVLPSFWGKERVCYQWWVRHRGSAAVRSPLSVERQQSASARCPQINSRQTIITIHVQVFLEVRAPCPHWEDRDWPIYECWD